MDPIDSVTRAMQLLRQRMAANLQKQEAAPLRATAGPVSAAPARPGPVRADIAKRLRAMDADDPRYRERATEAFVEGVLLSEFGSEFTNDSQFRQLILGVAREMRSQAETAQQLDALIQDLRAQ